jgi:hypothetical protein
MDRLSVSGATAHTNVISVMEQRRFFEARSEESGEWLVLDAKRHPPRVICRCHGWNAPKNAALIVAALEAHDSELYSKFALGSSGRLDERPAVKASLLSGDVEPTPPAPKPPARKSRAGHRG